MIFARGEVDKSQGDYDVTTEVFLKGETLQLICEFSSVGNELIKNLDKIPKDIQGLFAEKLLAQLSELGANLVVKYQEVSKE